MDTWLKTVGDSSAVSQKEMINQMWTGAYEPTQTVQPDVALTGNTAVIPCEMWGIGWVHSKAWR
ncbi:hypothetical protein GCM10028807_62530 [Spirosoma daeguense]